MMKLVAALFLGFLSANAFASAGYTYLSHISHSLHVEEHILTLLLVSLIFIVIGGIYRATLSNASNAIIPDTGISFRNLFEALGEFIYNLTRNIIGEKQAKKYYIVIMILFSFVFMNNLIGLIPGFSTPTSNINTTLALGLFVFFYYNYHGIREQGLIGHIKHFMGPVWYLCWLIFPIEIISHLVRPLSLGLRLQGNMEGDHLVLSIFSGLVPYLVPIPFYILGIFVCFMQAFVFTLLTMVYINLATEHHDHDAHEAHH